MDTVLVLYGVVTALAGGLFWRKVDDVDKRLDRSGEAIAENLAQINALNNEMGRHDERGKYLKEHLDAIFNLLREIDTKLDKKADKP